MLVTPALRLTTFGGCALASDERALGPAVAQRRPLAVLALLAAAGEAGMSREKIAAILWPDAEPERARRTLTQVLYSLRRATHAEELFVGVADLRLNAAAVVCDCVEFDAALREGRLADAVERYRGPFLDGFAVPGAEEFERWLETERQRFARRCADALRELVRRAGREGDVAAEVAWSRRWVALDALDSVATLALVDALGRAGDLPGAQRAVRIHEQLVRDELGLPVAPAITERLAAHAARIAAADAERPVAAPRPAVPAAPHPVPVPEVRADDATVGEQRPVVAPRRRPTASRLAAGLALLAAFVASGIALGVALGRRGQPAPVAESAGAPPADVVAVLPFALATADSSVAFLRQGAADLLARMLDGRAGPRSVDPGTVLAALAAVPAPDGVVTADQARAIGRRVGAGEVLVGRIEGSAERLTVSAVLVDVASGARRASADASGPADSLSALVDALAARLVARRDLGADRAGGGAFGGVSLATLRAYLRAESAYHEDRYQEAVALYGQTLVRDSTFAPAALGLAVAADRLNSAEQHDRGLALAWAARDRLGERDRAYLVALAGPRYPEPSPASEQLAAWENAVAVTPDRAEAWSELGERFFYDGALLGIRNAEARAAAAFRRALALDPAEAAARRYLIELAVRAGDRQALATIATPAQVRAVGGDLTGYLAWRVALALDDSTALARVREGIPSLGEPSLRAIAMAAQYDGVGLADGARALRYLAAQAALGAEQLDVLLAQHSLALDTGRPIVALDVTEQLQDVQPGARAHLRLRVLDALYADGDSAAAEHAAWELVRTADGPSPADERARAIRLADACVLAQWRAAPWRARRADAVRGELALARRAAATLRAEPMPRIAVPVGTSARACADVVDAMAAVAAGATDARARVEGLDALMLTGPAAGDASAWGTLAVARLFERLGDPARALNAVRQRPYMKGWPRYLASALREEARLARLLGDAPAAAAAEARLRALRAPSS